MSKEMFVKQNFINGMAAQEEIHKGKKKEIGAHTYYIARNKFD